MSEALSFGMSMSISRSLLSEEIEEEGIMSFDPKAVLCSYVALVSRMIYYVDICISSMYGTVPGCRLQKACNRPREM